MLAIMDEIRQGLRYVFQTDSPYTLCVSGTGHAGMEAAIANLLEPGETIVVGNIGIWGTRVCDMAERFGAKVRAAKGGDGGFCWGVGGRMGGGVEGATRLICGAAMGFVSVRWKCGELRKQYVGAWAERWESVGG